MNWHASRTRALDALNDLLEVMEDSEASERRLILSYVEAKVELAVAFQTLVQDRYQTSPELDTLKAQIGQAMQTKHKNLPPKYLSVKGFGRVHQMLLGYLWQRRGSPVPVAELRILTHDAVHTERRIRELRDLGLDVSAVRHSGANVYTLAETPPDLDRAVALLVGRNIKDDKQLAAHERERWLTQVAANTLHEPRRR